MSFSDLIKRGSNKLLAGLALCTALAFSPELKADERISFTAFGGSPTNSNRISDDSSKKTSELPQRSLYLPTVVNNSLADPRESFEANAYDTDTINSLAGKVGDFLGRSAKFDEHFIGRLSLVGLHEYFLMSTSFLSHEVAHNMYSRLNRRDYLSFNTNFNSDAQKMSILFFNVDSNSDPSLADVNNPDPFIFSVAAGLNQQEFNSSLAYEKFSKENHIFFDDSLNFLLQKSMAFQYSLMGRSNNITYNSIDDIQRKEIVPVYDAQGNKGLRTDIVTAPVYDPQGYRVGLKLNGVSLSEDALLLQDFLPMALSYQTWWCTYAVGSYLFEGERTTPQMWVKIKDTEVTLPLLSGYRTPNGGFYNWAAFVKFYGAPIVSFEVGHDLDFIGDGKLNTLRFGAKMHDISCDFSKKIPISLSPYFALNINRDFSDYRGILAGIDVGVPIYSSNSGSFGIKGTLEYSNGDTLENVIKGEDQGVNFSFGAVIKF